MTPDQEIAELKLQLHLLNQRWEMSNRMVKELLRERERIAFNLYKFNIIIDGTGIPVKTGNAND